MYLCTQKSYSKMKNVVTPQLGLLALDAREQKEQSESGLQHIRIGKTS